MLASKPANIAENGMSGSANWRSTSTCASLGVCLMRTIMSAMICWSALLKSSSALDRW